MCKINENTCYICGEDRDSDDGSVDADGYGYHASCESKRLARIADGRCWACNEPINDGDVVSDNVHEACLVRYGHGEYVGL